MPLKCSFERAGAPVRRQTGLRRTGARWHCSVTRTDRMETAVGTTWYPLGRFLSFRGRINRAAFWGSVLLAFTLIGVGFSVADGSHGAVEIAGDAVGIFGFYVLWTTEVKRWHDRGKSGFWMFIALIPLLG